MSTSGPVASAADNAGQQATNPLSIGSLFGTIARGALMYWAMTYFTGNNQQKAKMNKDPAAYTLPKVTKGMPVDMYLFINQEQYVPQGRYDMSDLVWSEESLPVADPGSVRTKTMDISIPEAVQQNGTLYAHVVFAKAGKTINPDDPEYEEDLLFGRTERLTIHMPRPKNTTGVNLLASDMPTQVVPDAGPREVINFLKPNLTIQLVDHFVAYPKSQIPATVMPWMQFAPDSNYYPIIYFNDFWLLRDKLVPVNETLTSTTLHLDTGHLAFFWWQLQLQMTKSFETQKTMGMQQEGESDELKRVFLEGNPILLAVTMVVSLLHTVFDMLAFKNDIGFWKNNKSMEGLSARSVLINAFCQLVILLYLFDNDTSFVILLSATLGTAIEFWKVTKAMDVSFQPNFPFVKFQDRASYDTNNTKKHDEDAMRYLSYALYPLVAGYAIYSLMYKSHKSWYSWIISSLVGAVYMFGFILMCPQLYLNYKLKSVAALPWRQMTYKFLNTIIDDLFAFVIKMPTMHRLSVFRDDLIFLIYIYQRWIYPTDNKRVNEFGFQAESTEEPAQVEGAAETAGAEDGADDAPALAIEDKKAAPGGSRRRRGKAAAEEAASGEDNQQGGDGETEKDQ